jgi:choloylglycine hydrolase
MCTNILLSARAEPGQPERRLHVSARVMEIGVPAAHAVHKVPQHQHFPWRDFISDPHRWHNAYGFLGIGGTGLEFEAFPILYDGINEEGLSCGALSHQGIAYPQVAASHKAGKHPHPQYVCYVDLVAWVLGNFARVRDVEERLQSGEVQIVGIEPAEHNPADIPLHFIAIDRDGECLVIEFEQGQIQLYGPDFVKDFKQRVGEQELGYYINGALTNRPGYLWHAINLGIYRNVSPVEAASLYDPYPMNGNCLVGLPGDSSPPSRFVRAVMFQKAIGLLAKDGDGWLPAPWHPNLPQHSHGFSGSLQTIVNIGLQGVQQVMATTYGTLVSELSEGNGGARQEREGRQHRHVADWSVWTVARDHTNRSLYFVSAFNNIPQAIHLSELDFANRENRQYYPHFPLIGITPPASGVGWYQNATNAWDLEARAGHAQREKSDQGEVVI